MTEDELETWLAELVDRKLPTFSETMIAVGHRTAGATRYRQGPATEWLTDGHAALVRNFPAGDPILTSWAKATRDLEKGPQHAKMPSTIDAAAGVLRSALAQVRGKRTRSIVDEARVSTIDEVLEQAEELASAAPVAAAVLCGGALETHLRHLCDRHGLTWAGAGSITNYSKAIAAARNTGTCTVLWEKTTTKRIEAWGGMRNDAAHDPTKFANEHDARDVRRMIEDVRSFLERWP